jgi:hypothetical protein
METLLSLETQEALASLAQATARFEALAIRTGENAQAFIADLKEDRKNFELSKKLLA